MVLLAAKIRLKPLYINAMNSILDFSHNRKYKGQNKMRTNNKYIGLFLLLTLYMMSGGTVKAYERLEINQTLFQLLSQLRYQRDRKSYSMAII